MNQVTVRDAGPADAEALARLISGLGYPSEPEAVRRRMERIALDPGYATYIAEDEAGRALGMVGVMRGMAYNYDEPFARILALVVDEEVRGRGVGAALVRRAEEWAAAAGAPVVHLTTASHRGGAHAFYERIGYEATGLRFQKRLVL